MNLRALVWRISAILCGLAALMTAYGGNAMCFAWVVAGWLEWKIANNLAKKEEETNDDDR